MSGDLCTRKQLFGDWLGLRSGLAAHGIVADLQLTQFYQGVASGGEEPNALLHTGAAATFEPNQRATVVELFSRTSI